jgi:hypothetical protein
MNVHMQLDPLNIFLHTKSYNSARIMDEIGLLVTWAVQKPESMTMHAALENNYGFPLSDIEGVGVTDEGVWIYAGDPDLYPLAKLTCEGETLHIYSYGLVAFIDEDGETYVTRMD